HYGENDIHRRPLRAMPADTGRLACAASDCAGLQPPSVPKPPPIGPPGNPPPHSLMQSRMHCETIVQLRIVQARMHCDTTVHERMHCATTVHCEMMQFAGVSAGAVAALGAAPPISEATL